MPLEIERLQDRVLQSEREIRRLRLLLDKGSIGQGVRNTAVVGVLPSAQGGTGITGSPLGGVDMWKNASGGVRTQGTVVVVNGDRTFGVTTIVSDPLTIGVMDDASIAVGVDGRVRHVGYQAVLKVQGAVTAGHYLRASATAERAEDAGVTGANGVFAIALTAFAGPGAGTVAAYLIPIESGGGGGGGNHNLLDGAVVLDSVAAATARGAIVRGNSTPKWGRLLLGPSGQYLRSDGTDLVYSAIPATDLQTVQDEGSGLTQRLKLNIKGNYQQAIDDAANQATVIRGSVSHFDAIVDSNQHEILDSGTATAGGATTLTDGAKTWAVDNWARCRVIITGGTGANQVRIVASNTATVLTVTVGWGIIPDATSTYIIQPGVPVYRRLQEAIAGGAYSILYRASSGEVDFTITATDTVGYILGDNPNTIFPVSVAITCQKAGLVFQNLKFSGNHQLDLVGIGAACVGCVFAGAAYVRLNGSGASLVACFCTTAGGAAQPPVVVNSTENRIQACSFILQNSSSLIQMTATAARTTVTGCLNVANAETGYLIDCTNTANTSTINGNLLEVPSTATGAIRTQIQANVSGNFIVFNFSPAATYEGIILTGRGNLVTGNLIQFAGSISSSLAICKAMRISGPAQLINGNIVVLTSYNTLSQTNPDVAGISIDAGGAINGSIITGNAFVIPSALLFNSGAAQPKAIDPLDDNAAAITVLQNSFSGSTFTPPFPWVPCSRITSKTIIDYNAGVPKITVYRLEQVEDFIVGASPAGWTGFGASGPTYPSVRGGIVRCATGTTGNADSGIRQDTDHVSLAAGLSAGFGAHFNPDRVTEARIRIGLGLNAAWLTAMARPATGMFLELDTALTDSDSGTATGNTVNDVTDSGKAWIVNQWAGHTVTINAQTRAIISNTATKLSVTPAFSPAPGNNAYTIDAGSAHYHLFVTDGGTIRIQHHPQGASGAAASGLTYIQASIDRSNRLFTYFNGLFRYSGAIPTLPTTLVTPGAYVRTLNTVTGAVTMDIEKIAWGCDEL